MTRTFLTNNVTSSTDKDRSSYRPPGASFHILLTAHSIQLHTYMLTTDIPAHLMVLHLKYFSLLIVCPYLHAYSSRQYSRCLQAWITTDSPVNLISLFWSATFYCKFIMIPQTSYLIVSRINHFSSGVSSCDLVYLLAILCVFLGPGDFYCGLGVFS